MSKHICPYCEKIHLEPRYIKVDMNNLDYELPGLVCPKCKAELFLSQEVRNFLNSKTSTEIKEKITEFQ